VPIKQLLFAKSAGTQMNWNKKITLIRTSKSDDNNITDNLHLANYNLISVVQHEGHTASAVPSIFHFYLRYSASSTKAEHWTIQLINRLISWLINTSVLLTVAHENPKSEELSENSDDGECGSHFKLKATKTHVHTTLIYSCTYLFITDIVQIVHNIASKLKEN